jgi:hypothetical protein
LGEDVVLESLVRLLNVQCVDSILWGFPLMTQQVVSEPR